MLALHTHSFCERSLSQAKRLHELLRQDFTDRRRLTLRHHHRVPHLPIAMVVQIDALRFTTAAVPLEDQPPLPAYADRMEARKIAAQLFEMIAGRHTQILIGRRIVNHLELAKKAAFEIGRDLPGAGIFDKESPQPFIPKADDHAATPLRVYVLPYGTLCKY